MLSSHLPRAPCDEFVYDFPCSFLGIVRSLGTNPYRGCAEIVRKLCNLSGVAMQSPQPPDGNHTEPVRLPCRGCVEMVRWLWCHRAVFVCAASVRCQCGDCAMPSSTCLRATDLRFSNLYNFPLNTIVEAAEPVNPYKNLTAASCLRTEASRRQHRKGDTGKIRAP